MRSLRSTARTVTYDPGADVLARYPDVVVRWRHLGGVPAAVCRRRRVILIEHDMPAAERRCALAHEIAHLDLDHRAPIHEGNEERLADELSAARLLPTDRLAQVLRWALSPEEVADELGVTTHLVRVRLRALTACEKQRIEDQLSVIEASA